MELLVIILIIIFIAICLCIFYFSPQNSEKPYNPSEALVGERKRTPLSNPNHLEHKTLSSTKVIVLISNLNEYNYKVVGTSHYQEALTRIAKGKSSESTEIETKAILRLEPNNPYDGNAVAVYVSSSNIGYLSRKDAFDFTSWVKDKGLYGSVSSFQVNAIILGGWKRTDGEGNFGVSLNLPDDLDDLKTH